MKRIIALILLLIPAIGFADGFFGPYGQSDSIPVAQNANSKSYIYPATTFTTLTYADNAGNVQLSSAGVHSLTTSPAVGASVYVTWSGGTGVSGWYPIVSVDSTTAFTISYTYAAGLGTPVVDVAGSGTRDILDITLPPMSATGSFRFHFAFSGTSSSNNKNVQWNFNSSYWDSNSYTGNHYIDDFWLYNRNNSTTSQLYVLNQTYTSTESFSTGSANTMSILISAAAPNELITLEAYTIFYYL